MSDWMLQEYFWIAVAIPAAISAWAVMSTWPAASVLGPWTCSVGFTTLLAVPPLQPYLHALGQSPMNVYAPPVFVVAYLVWGRYELPSVRIAYAGTFLSLMIADFAGAWLLSQHLAPSEQPFFFYVGGAGMVDGLVLIPAGAALLVGSIKLILRRGHELSFLLGRAQYLSQKAPKP